jgi:hypothetical protein
VDSKLRAGSKTSALGKLDHAADALQMRGFYFLFQNLPKVVGVGLALLISLPFEHIDRCLSLLTIDREDREDIEKIVLPLVLPPWRLTVYDRTLQKNQAQQPEDVLGSASMCF